MNLNIDPTHSSIEFSVRHMGLATVKGRFERFDVDAHVGPDGTPQRVKVTIEADSINTGSADRDAHLRSADFFDVEQFPHIVYEADEFAREGGSLVAKGTLTMHGVSRPLAVTSDVSGPVTDPWGNQRFAAEASGKVNRTDYGLKWNQVLEAGSLLVGEDVRFTGSVQMVHAPTQKEAAVPA